MRKLYCVKLLIILCSLGATAQSFRIANCRVPLIPQKASMLCWAASMQMVTSYHNQPHTQCQLRGTFDDYLHTIYPDMAPLPDNFTATCESLTCDPAAFDQLQIGASGNWNDDLREASRFTPLFEAVSFMATVESQPLSWTALRAEIDQCRPLITVIQEGDGSGSIDILQHAVVSTGYVWIKNFARWPSARWLLINNPLEPANCQAETYLLNYPATTATNMSLHANRVIYPRSFVSGIQPTNADSRQACGPARKWTLNWKKKWWQLQWYPKEKWWLYWGLIYLPKVWGVRANQLIRNYYVSVPKLRDSTVTLQLDNVAQKTPVFDWVYERNKRAVAYTIQPIKNEQRLVLKISRSYYKRLFSCTVTGQKISLTYLIKVPGTIRYEYVRIRPLGHSYYRFSYHNRWYLVPAITYTFSDGTKLSPTIAYAETDVLRLLRNALA